MSKQNTCESCKHKYTTFDGMYSENWHCDLLADSVGVFGVGLKPGEKHRFFIQDHKNFGCTNHTQEHDNENR